jgi:predicted PurR-regulated permease PerM
MEKKKIPKRLAVFMCLLALISGIASIVSLLGWKIYDLVNDFTMIKKLTLETIRTIQIYIYNHLDISFKEQFQILKNEQPSYASIMQMLLESLMNFFTNLVLVLVYFLFLLYYRVHIKTFFVKYTTASQQVNMEHLINSAANISQQYLLGISKMIVILWILYGIGFSLLGVQNALFFAILCGLLEIVPYVGNITGTALTLLVAALHGADFSILGGIIIVYATIQMFQGWVLEPLILGPQVKVNPLFTIFALVLGELLWGISGMILAIPMIAIFKIICDHIKSLKSYGFLIGGIETEKKEFRFMKKIKVN